MNGAGHSQIPEIHDRFPYRGMLPEEKRELFRFSEMSLSPFVCIHTPSNFVGWELKYLYRSYVALMVMINITTALRLIGSLEQITLPPFTPTFEYDFNVILI